MGFEVYLVFLLFVLVLVYGIGKGNRIVVKIVFVFVGFEFLMVFFYLILGVLLYVVDVVMSFFIIYDVMGYIGKVY